MFTTGYGLYRTTNLTAAQPSWTFFNEGFEQSAVTELVSPNTGSVNLISAIGDRDGFRHVDFDVSPAAGVLGASNGMSRGTSKDIDVAWNDANHLVRTVQSSPYVQYSANNGVTWSWLSSTNLTGGNDGHTALSGDGTRVIYEPGGSGNQLLYATRTGSTWGSWQTPATNRPADGADILADLVDGNTFYAQSGSTISRSTDGGVNWSVMATNAPSGINSIRAVPNNAGHLVASAGGNGVHRSTNGGATWTRLARIGTTSNYYATDANAVGVGAAAPGGSGYPALFIAGTVSGVTGVHRSDDSGATWNTVTDADHQYGYLTVIQGDPRVYGRVYLGTNGRGVQVGDFMKPAGTLPTGWTDTDVGTVAKPGSGGSTATGKFELVGTGAGVSGSLDQFHFTHTLAGGDTTIVARVESVTGPTGNARASVILRGSTDADAAFAMVEMLDDGTVRFAWRDAVGVGIAATAPGGEYVSAKYLRLVRTGGSVAGSFSTDGTTWQSIGGAQTIAMPPQIRAGLGVTGADNTTLAKAVFTNVAITTDLVAPTISAISFDYATTPVSVRATFSENVIGSIAVGDLSVAPALGGMAFAPASFVYDETTRSVRFDLPANVPAGDYTATLGSFADLAGNASTTAGTVSFFHLPADINRDRVVGFDDLLVLAQNYGRTPPAAFADGDLTSDGLVDFDDLLLLAQNYGATAPLLYSVAPSASTTTKVKRRATLV